MRNNNYADIIDSVLCYPLLLLFQLYNIYTYYIVMTCLYFIGTTLDIILLYIHTHTILSSTIVVYNECYYCLLIAPSNGKKNNY